MNNNYKELIGLFSFKVLFLGSKSEREYPVITTHDDEIIRIYFKGQNIVFDDQEKFKKFIEKKIKIKGYVDDLRGHLRITIQSIKDIEIIEDRLNE